MKLARATFLCIIFVVVVCPSAQAQPDSVSLFYPLQDGNIWQYRSLSVRVLLGSLMGIDTSHYVLTVAGDTLMPNGKVYKKIEDANTSKPALYAHPWLQRRDTSNLQVFAYDTSNGGVEVQIDSLRLAPSSQSWPWLFYGSRIGLPTTWLMSVNSQVVFSDSVHCRTYLTGYFEFRHQYYTVAAGLGIIASVSGYPGEDMFAGNHIVDSLTYARVNGKEYGTLVGVNETGYQPVRFSLRQNYPNPFNTATTIEFSVDQTSPVQIAVFDCLGRELSVLWNTPADRGIHRLQFIASDLSSGVYFYRMTSGAKVLTRAMMLVK